MLANRRATIDPANRRVASMVPRTARAVGITTGAGAVLRAGRNIQAAAANATIRHAKTNRRRAGFSG